MRIKKFIPFFLLLPYSFRGDCMNDIQKSILNTIERRIRKNIKKLKFDYTITGKIISFDSSNNSYNVLYNGTELQVKAREGLNLQPNDLVYIRVVRGDFSEKFIDCKKP